MTDYELDRIARLANSAKDTGSEIQALIAMAIRQIVIKSKGVRAKNESPMDLDTSSLPTPIKTPGEAS